MNIMGMMFMPASPDCKEFHMSDDSIKFLKSISRKGKSEEIPSARENPAVKDAVKRAAELMDYWEGKGPRPKWLGDPPIVDEQE